MNNQHLVPSCSLQKEIDTKRAIPFGFLRFLLGVLHPKEWWRRNVVGYTLRITDPDGVGRYRYQCLYGSWGAQVGASSQINLRLGGIRFFRTGKHRFHRSFCTTGEGTRFGRLSWSIQDFDARDVHDCLIPVQDQHGSRVLMTVTQVFRFLEMARQEGIPSFSHYLLLRQARMQLVINTQERIPH